MVRLHESHMRMRTRPKLESQNAPSQEGEVLLSGGCFIVESLRTCAKKSRWENPPCSTHAVEFDRQIWHTEELLRMV